MLFEYVLNHVSELKRVWIKMLLCQNAHKYSRHWIKNEHEVFFLWFRSFILKPERIAVKTFSWSFMWRWRFVSDSRHISVDSPALNYNRINVVLFVWTCSPLCDSSTKTRKCVESRNLSVRVRHHCRRFHLPFEISVQNFDPIPDHFVGSQNVFTKVVME